jgi:hypothetical protein
MRLTLSILFLWMSAIPLVLSQTFGLSPDARGRQIAEEADRRNQASCA